MTIGIELLTFSLFDCVENLRFNYHKRKKMVKVKNLFLKFEVPLIFRVVPIVFSLLAYRETKPHRVWWKEPRQSTCWDLIIVIWHTILEMKDKKY
jgi:hypothetical protein